jgi:branched-chain amino acid transport system ATP-binding protein
VRTFQAARLFPQLSVLENVEAAALGTGIGRAEAGRRARSLLGRMELEPRALYKANSLPGGEQRILGIARALAMLPRFLLLDEPAAGLNESESARLVDAIRDIRRDFGCGVVVIEHDMRVIMPLCERIQVLNYGKTISIGSAAEVQGSPAVIEAYLGKSARHAAKH